MGIIIGDQNTRIRDEEVPNIIDRATIAIESLRTQWRTVAHLGTHERMAVSQLRVYGPMPMSELAARISLSRAAVTSLIDRLEAEQWVRRRADEHDRRRTVLELLPQANEIFGDVSRDFETAMVNHLRDIPESDRAAVLKFLLTASDIAEDQAAALRASALERSLV